MGACHLKQWLQYGNSHVAELKDIKEPCENFSSTKWLQKRVKVFVQCRQGILALGRLHHLTGESEHSHYNSLYSSQKQYTLASSKKG